jgi:hypothetical protein
MPKETKPFLALWVGGLLVAAVLLAAVIAAYFYSHTAKMRLVLSNRTHTKCAT